MKLRLVLLCALIGSLGTTGWAQETVKDRAEAIPGSGAARRAELGLGVSASPTLLTELYFSFLDRGLIARGGRTWLRVGVAPLAGWDNTQLTLERWETVWTNKHQRVELLAGAQWSHGNDWAARYDTLGVLLGLRYGYTWGRSTLGAHVSYVLGTTSWLHFTDAYRESYNDRYPNDRSTQGPEHATVWFGSHRIEGALNYTLTTARWSLWSALGVQASPTAGSLWSSLEVGQLPVLLSCAGGYRF